MLDQNRAAYAGSVFGGACSASSGGGPAPERQDRSGVAKLNPAQAISLNLKAHAPLRIARLVEAQLLAGRPDSAIQLAERALVLSREHKERGHEAYVLRLLGEVESHGDPPGAEKAEAYYRQARGLAEELGMRPFAARCYASLGQLHRRTGEQQQADKCFTTAADLARAMDMRLPLTVMKTQRGDPRAG